MLGARAAASRELLAQCCAGAVSPDGCIPRTDVVLGCILRECGFTEVDLPEQFRVLRFEQIQG
jgi:hypothetical protein